MSLRSIDIPGASHNAPIPAAARVGQILCSSAISGKDAATGQLSTDPVEQTRHAFANLKALLSAGGAKLTDVVKMTIYLKDNSLREAINVEWNACFPDPHDRPARHILNYELQHGLALQIEVMAVIQ